MPRIEPVTYYKTSDGVIHDTKEKALHHEETVVADKVFTLINSGAADRYSYRDELWNTVWDSDGLKKFLIGSRTEILEALTI